MAVYLTSFINIGEYNMFNSNIQIGTINIELDNIKGTENGKNFSIDGKINIGLSVNSQVLTKFEPLLDKAMGFEINKITGKNRIQKALDEVELLRLEVEKKRLEKQLRDLNK